MIRFIEREILDQERWDSLVKSSKHFRHYTLSYFLDATCESWGAIVKGDYEWIWPIPIKKSPLKQVIQPLLAQQLGPILKEGISISPMDIIESWQLLKRKFWKINVKFSDRFLDLPFETSSHVNVELSLGRPHLEIAKNYNRNAQSNIKKAANANLEFVVSTQFDESVLEMFRLSRGLNLKLLDNEFYCHVESIYKAFEKRNEAETWYAKKNDEVFAAIMLLITNQRILTFFTASNTKGRESGAMHGLMDTIIKQHSERFLMLDFEGSDDKNLAYFYKSFGGNERVYLQAQSGWWPPVFN